MRRSGINNSTEQAAALLTGAGVMPGDRVRWERQIDTVLASLSQADLPGLDHAMRWRSGYHDRRAMERRWWHELPTAKALTCMTVAENVVSVAAVMSMHRSGYTRQAAVAELARHQDQHVLPWLVLRAGDWVDPVREAAEAALAPWLSAEHAESLLAILPLLAGERFADTRPAAQTKVRVMAALSSPEGIAAAVASVGSPDPAIRRAAVRMLVPKEVTVELLRAAMDTNDVVNIARVAAALETTGPVSRAAGELLFTSTSARFRSEGLWRLLREPDVDHDRLLELGLLDSAPSVRDEAQRWMRDHGREPRAFYRRLVDSNPLAMLDGLADHPEPGDAALAEPYREGRSSSLAVAALRLLATIGRNEDRELFIDRFVTGSRRERVEALRGLRRTGVNPTVVDELWRRALLTGTEAAAARVLYQILPMVDRWHRLDLALQAAALDSAGVSAAGVEAVRRLRRWQGSGYPSKPTVEPSRLRELAEAAEPALRTATLRNPGFGRVQEDLYETVEAMIALAWE